MRFFIQLFLVIFSATLFAQTVELRTDSTIIVSKLRIKNHNEANGRVLTSDANGNARWASFPTFPSFSLPYFGGISSTDIAFSIFNSDPNGFVMKTAGNLLLSNIEEQKGKILFSTDDDGNAKWGNGTCISRCSFSLTRNIKANLGGNAVQFLPFDSEVFDICEAASFIDISGDNDFHTFTAPYDGIYQFEFTGTFNSPLPFTLGIYTVSNTNTPQNQLFVSAAPGSPDEQTQRFTAILKLNAGQKIAPTIKGSTSNASIAFNNLNESNAIHFSGYVIEATDCFTK